MDLSSIYKKAQNYKIHFFYGEIDVIAYFEFSDGIFLLGKTGEETELLWGVNKISALIKGLKVIKKRYKGEFIFRYAGSINDVIDKKKIINRYGYTLEKTHIAYFCQQIKGFDIDSDGIFNLQKNEIDEFLKVEKLLFTEFNITKAELITWLNDEDYIILTYKADNQILGFIVINVYGKSNCFIRNIGVINSKRQQGIGTKLLLSGLNKALDKGINKAMLWVEINNIGARKLYEKFGFIKDENEVEVVFKVVEEKKG